MPSPSCELRTPPRERRGRTQGRASSCFPSRRNQGSLLASKSHVHSFFSSVSSREPSANLRARNAGGFRSQSTSVSSSNPWASPREPLFYTLSNGDRTYFLERKTERKGPPNGSNPDGSKGTNRRCSRSKGFWFRGIHSGWRRDGLRRGKGWMDRDRRLRHATCPCDALGTRRRRLIHPRSLVPDRIHSWKKVDGFHLEVSGWMRAFSHREPGRTSCFEGKK